jgi:hypothetical protein
LARILYEEASRWATERRKWSDDSDYFRMHIKPTYFAQADAVLKAGYFRAALRSDSDEEPVAWALFADNGNIRLWSTEPAGAMEVGALPLYLHPAAMKPEAPHDPPR